MMAPITTAVVGFIKLKCFTRLIPMITFASPITTVPVPIDISKKPFI